MDESLTSELFVVASDAEAAPLLAAIGRAERISLDTEANSLHRYHSRVCLIQLSIDGQDWIVDPLAKLDLRPILAALAVKPLIFHNADYDLRMMRIDLGFRPQAEVSDTAIAAQLLGYPQIGLVDLAGQLLGVELCKRGQKSDWSQRPLTAAQLDYARQDTRHLPSLAQRLEDELARRGRLAWYRESCERMVQATAIDGPKPEREPWRVRGSTHLGPRELAFLREVWQWREEEAQRADRPPFKIMIDGTLMELALWAERNGHPEQRIEVRLPRNCVGARLERLKRALARAGQMSEADWPAVYKHPARQPLDGGTRTLAERIITICAEVAAGLELPPAALAPRATLTAIAKHRATNIEEMLAHSPIMRWQAELLAPHILPVIAN